MGLVGTQARYIHPQISQMTQMAFATANEEDVARAHWEMRPHPSLRGDMDLTDDIRYRE